MLATPDMKAFGAAGLMAVLSGCGGECWFSCESLDRAEDYFDVKRAAAALDPTPEDAMPGTGTATYRGFARTNYYYAGSYAGSYAGFLDGVVVLEADFGAPGFTGRIDDFYHLNGSVEGALLIENGQITGSTLAADVSGSVDQSEFLINGGTPGSAIPLGPGTVTVDGTLSGGFRGDEAQAVSIGIKATAVFEDDVSGVITGDGAAFAE